MTKSYVWLSGVRVLAEKLECMYYYAWLKLGLGSRDKHNISQFNTGLAKPKIGTIFNALTVLTGENRCKLAVMGKIVQKGPLNCCKSREG